ncbi:MAG: hypothetical protein RJA94_1885 [Pseudomonadota bacterium]|jgi:LysR family glycine cleavage system transcriptional activator
MPRSRNLPPLNALKAFEASARLGGFVRAARELGVTAAAVSLQVKSLESFYGAELFFRHSNGISLTSAGDVVYRISTEALGSLNSIAERIAGREQTSHIVVSVLSSLAPTWLYDALTVYRRDIENIRFEIREEADPVAFGRDNVDIRITYGAHIYPDHAVAELFTDRLAPMCSPEFAKAHSMLDAAPDALPDDDLIHTYWGAAFLAYPTWSDWFAACGIERRHNLERENIVGMAAGAIDLAAAGAGVALGQIFMAQKALSAGKLVMPFDCRLMMQHPYVIVLPKLRLPHPAVKRLVDWLAVNAAARASLIE